MKRKTLPFPGRYMYLLAGSMLDGSSKTKKNKRDSGDKKSIAPTRVAVPFPPFKPANIIQLCPATAATTASMGIKICPPDNKVASHATSAPFPISITATIVPAIFPILKKTLEAPTLLFPIFRISIPFIRPAIYAVGIEPIR